jgi:hypothetical protein
MGKNMKLNQCRRNVLQKILVAAGMSVLPAQVFAQSQYRGKLLITLQLAGGADVTSFCDPKSNVAGQQEINRWARTQQIRKAGNLDYAPYASNAAFFDKYYRNLLVINGVDAQTNSHSVGVVHNWSGRNAEGFPSLTALFAAVQQPQLPMTYLNFGGFGATQGVTRSTLVSDTRILRNLVLPNQTEWDATKSYVAQSDLQRIMALHNQQQGIAIAERTLIAGNKFNHQLYIDSLLKTDEIAALASYIPSADKLQARRTVTATHQSNLHQQVQLALLAFKAGVSVSADLVEGGFDTHARHDIDHPLLLSNATDAIDYLWAYAEELGLADRIVLVIGSDFGRTPHFNASDGKDHWPIGSTLIMEKNAAYTNRMLGKTDEKHNALKINPATLLEDGSKGVVIKPAHVHKALRRYLGIENSGITQAFAFANTEDFRFFG